MSIMQNDLLVKVPGYKQIEYSIILNPHAVLREKILKIRNEVNSKYNPTIQLHNKPNIRLAKFFSLEMMEEKLMSHLKMITMGTPPFKIHLKDYGSFPMHTLFINVSSKIPLQMLMKNLRTIRPLIKSPDREPHFAGEFYIPLAIKLDAVQYENAWREYSHRRFTGSFIADGMLLLKRTSGQKSYQIAERFEFMNLPVSIKQGELFA
jgi:2'-5' RNA ligase